MNIHTLVQLLVDTEIELKMENLILMEMNIIFRSIMENIHFMEELRDLIKLFGL